MLSTRLSAFLMTAVALVALRPFAARAGLLDIPGGRKTHTSPTPMIGGMGIYMGTLSICMHSPVIMNDYKILMALSGFVLLVGVLDDLYDIRVSLRMAMHATAAWVMAVTANVQLTSLVEITFNGPVELGLLAIPVTIFATVGVINAINMSDGLDGLSGGLSVISLVLLSVAALSAGESALVYLRDAGSTLLGFIIAWLLIASTQGDKAFIAPVYALWFLAVPLMDTISLMIRRPLRSSSPFKPGRDHLHHRLLNMGFDTRQTVLIIHVTALALGGVGLAGHFAGAPQGLMLMLFITSFAIYLLASRHPLPEDNRGLTR